MEIHPVQCLIDEVESSHPGLGSLAAISTVAAKARQCLIVVSPPGCGKSTVGRWLCENHEAGFLKDSLTRSSLKSYEDQFNGFTGLVVFDDLGKVDTDWSRMQTLVTMAELVHGHFISKDAFQLKIEIDDFYGSAVLNIQPNILRRVIEQEAWHSNLADKTLRYYHLRRATAPNRQDIMASIAWGLPLDDVLSYDGESPIWDAILDIGLEQWTRPRALEHCHDMAKALAAMRESYSVDDADLALLLELMRPMTVEMEVIEKKGFGSNTTLNENLVYLLVEFATYSQLTYADIAQDYHLRPKQVMGILGSMVDWFEKVGWNPVILQPTEQLNDVLRKAGIR